MLRQLQIRNFRSIGEATVELGALNVFVGLNGAGKSNLLDSLAFVGDCLSESVEMAFKNRGGIAAVRRSSAGHPHNIGLRLILELDEATSADYSFEISARQNQRFEITKERCVVRRMLDEDVTFEVRQGTFTTPIPGVQPKLASDRLALFAASAVEPFRAVFDFLTNMPVYAIEPFKLREYQDSDNGDVLKRDGSNAAAVLKRLEDAQDTTALDRVQGLLSQAVTGIVGVEHVAVSQKETIRFRQDIGAKNAWTFEALNMSDGTLRLLGLLLAVYQHSRSPVIAIEEPESTVHPAITELIVQVLVDASRERQILITTHSPDLLDSTDISDDQIRVVLSDHNRTSIAPVSEFGREAIRTGLYTAGELLRLNELNPDTAAADALTEQLNLFGRPFAPVV